MFTLSGAKEIQEKCFFEFAHARKSNANSRLISIFNKKNGWKEHVQ